MDRFDDLEDRVDKLENSIGREPSADAHAPSDPPADERAADDPTQTQDGPTGGSAASERVAEAVREFAESNWSDTEERRRARARAAEAVVQQAVETGEAVGKSDVDDVFEEYPVEGQMFETWWRKNVRPVLKEFGEYDNGRHGYVVTDLA